MTIIDCNTCPVRGQHCSNCFVPVVAGAWLGRDDDPYFSAQERAEPPGPRNTGADPRSSLPLTDAEWDAVDVFIGAGLVNALDVLDLVAHPDTSLGAGWLRVG